MNIDSDVNDLQSLKELSLKKTEIKREDNRVRNNALHEMAFSIGARGGLAWRTKQISEDLEKKSDQLDKVFDFRRLLISHSPTKSGDGVYTILPPVIFEADQVAKASGSILEIADKFYQIDKQARFVTNPPNWRDYLQKDFPKVEQINHVLLPKTGEEKELWSQWIEEGWQQGINQADVIFDINLSKIEKDIKGMILYRSLLNKKMVSLPYVIENNRGVTGGGDSLSVDERVLTITALPSLNRKASDWKPMVKINKEHAE